MTTAADGSFSISGDYVCAQNSQVYLYVVGGNPGAGINPSAGLMAVLGNCPAEGNFAAATPFVSVNEVSTVAAAYAMAGFAQDALHVSSKSTAPALTGIANAFANAANLASLATGTALAATPAGNGVVPQAEINTLANILAACVNSNGALVAPTDPCYTLFASATSDGTPGGNQPTDTATASINIAHNPAANMDSLFGLAPASAPFLPALAVEPNDFTVALTFTGGGLDQPSRVAIDGAGSAWIVNADASANSIVELSAAGAVLSGPSGYTGGGLADPLGIAIDSAGDAWITSPSGNNVTELSSTGAVLSGPTGYTSTDMNLPAAIAFDLDGNAWIANFFGSSVTELSSAGAVLSGAYRLRQQRNGRLRRAGSGWRWQRVGRQIRLQLHLRVLERGAVLSANNGFTGGGLYHPTAIALDGSNHAWVVNRFGSLKSQPWQRK